MICTGDHPFEQPAQHWLLRCQEELCFSTNHFWSSSNPFVSCQYLLSWNIVVSYLLYPWLQKPRGKPQIFPGVFCQRLLIGPDSFQVHCREHFLHLAPSWLAQELLNELINVWFVQRLVIAEGSIWNYFSSRLFDREGLQSDCSLKCAFSKSPQCLKEACVSFTLVDGDKAVVLFFTSTGTWQYKFFQFILKNWVSYAHPLTLLWFTAKTAFRKIWAILPFLRNFCCYHPHTRHQERWLWFDPKQQIPHICLLSFLPTVTPWSEEENREKVKVMGWDWDSLVIEIKQNILILQLLLLQPLLLIALKRVRESVKPGKTSNAQCNYWPSTDPCPSHTQTATFPSWMILGTGHDVLLCYGLMPWPVWISCSSCSLSQFL